MLLSKEQIEKYIKCDGSYCPYCGSCNIEGSGDRNADGNWISSAVECLDCGCNWLDIYELVDIVESH
jgi:hypothetical protein